MLAQAFDISHLEARGLSQSGGSGEGDQFGIGKDIRIHKRPEGTAFSLPNPNTMIQKRAAWLQQIPDMAKIA